MYKKILDKNGKELNHVIFRDADNAWIPCDPSNRDYQAFLQQKLDINSLEEMK